MSAVPGELVFMGEFGSRSWGGRRCSWEELTLSPWTCARGQGKEDTQGGTVKSTEVLEPDASGFTPQLHVGPP